MPQDPAVFILTIYPNVYGIRRADVGRIECANDTIIAGNRAMTSIMVFSGNKMIRMLVPMLGCADFCDALVKFSKGDKEPLSALCDSMVMRTDVPSSFDMM